MTKTKKAPAPEVNMDLFEVALQVVPSGATRIRVGDVIPRPGLNTRTHFDEAELRDLAQSIASIGLQQPLVLHETRETVKHLLAGERRWRACMLISPDLVVPCTIREYTEAEMIEIMITENFQRRDLTAIEQARGFQMALTIPGMKQSHLAKRLGVSQPTISNSIRLLQLPDDVLALIDAGDIEVSHARDVLVPFTVIPENVQPAFWKKFVAATNKAAQYDRNEHGLRRRVSEIAKQMSFALSERVSYGDEAPLFDVEKHAECPCGGVEIPAQFGGGKEVRCFNPAWWNSAQGAAKSVVEKREGKKKQKLAATAARLGGRPLYKAQKFYENMRHGKDFIDIADRTGAFADGAFDPSILDVDKLAIVEHEDSRAYVLVCLDVKAVENAREVFATQCREREQARAAEQDERDLAESRKLKLEGPALRALLKAASSYDTEWVELGAAIGVTFEGDYVETDEVLDTLTDAQLLAAARLLAVRSMRETEGGKQYLYVSGLGSLHGPAVLAYKEMLSGYEEALRSIIPWEIKQEWLDEDREDVGETDEEDALEEDAFEDEPVDEEELAEV